MTSTTASIGREQEEALLAECWTLAVQGEGQVALIGGEAGIGKSRLIRSFEARLDGEMHRHLTGRGSPYHRYTALLPVAEMLRGVLGADDDTLPEQQLARLEELCPPDSLPVIASMLALPLPPERDPKRLLPPEALRQQTLAALVNLMIGLSEQQPLLLVVEDLHWVDPSTLEWIGRLIEKIATARILLVLTARPEFKPPWGSGRIAAITLTRLGRGATERLVTLVAHGKTLPAEVVEQIVVKTDGIPLFVEELTKSLLESGFLREDGDRYALAGRLQPLQVPASLQESLVARLDRLDEAKATAQLGAVIGRTFSYAVLKAISGRDDETLARDLSSLVDAELLQRSGIGPAASYTFRHALIRDAAYQALPKNTQRERHEQLARTLEARFPGSPPELLAHHYTEAGLAAVAATHWQRAGEDASRRTAYAEAIGHLMNGMRMVEALPDSPDRRRLEMSLRIALGVPLVATKGYGAREVETSYNRARDLCLLLDDQTRLFPVLRGLWNFRLVRAELDKARELGDQLLRLARRGAARGELVAAHRALGVTLFSLGDFTFARQHLEHAISAYDPTQHGALAPEHGADPCVVSMMYAGSTIWALGYPDQALQRSRDGLALAEKLSHTISIAVALTSASRFHQLRGERQEAFDHASKVIALSEQQGLPYWAALGGTLRGWAVAKDGKAEEGIAAMQRGRAALRATGAGLVEPWNLTVLADAYRDAGDVTLGLGLLGEALALAERTGERWWEAEIYRLQGELQLASSGEGTEVEAETRFQRALAVSRRQRARSLELRAALSLARLWLSKGRRDEARQLVAEIHGWFTEGFDTVDLKAAKAFLDASA